MNTIDLLIKLICFVAIGGIIWWLLNLVPLPQPIRIVVCVVLGIAGILLLADIGGLGHGYFAVR